VAVLYGRLNKKAVPLPGERVDQQERPQDWFLRPDLVLLTPSAFLEFSLNRLHFLEMMAKSRQHVSGKIRSIHILVQIRARVLLIAGSWFLPRRLLPGSIRIGTAKR